MHIVDFQISNRYFILVIGSILTELTETRMKASNHYIVRTHFDLPVPFNNVMSAVNSCAIYMIIILFRTRLDFFDFVLY